MYSLAGLGACSTLCVVTEQVCSHRAVAINNLDDFPLLIVSYENFALL